MMKVTKSLSVFAALLLLLFSSPIFSQNMTLRGVMDFPGNTIANVCGYEQDGHEYALLGGSKGLIIVEVTNPDVPVKITQIPGPDNTWKEIKVYGHYAYTVTEGGQGVQITDLAALPSSTLQYKHYLGDGAIAGQLNTIHALHIDVAKGFLYAYGSNLFNGGAVVLDLSDPWNPTYAGKYDQFGYIHDGYVDNDTLYAGHINIGQMAIVNMADKANPEVISLTPTPHHFTHNTWLSTDRKTVFTTDEVPFSTLASFDVSDPTEPKLLDKVQINPDAGTIVHNTHVLGNYAITAWYTSGVVITDVTRPDILVNVGQYDTWPQDEGTGFNGCWGTYPYLPSGNIVAANIPNVGSGTGRLFMLTPNYVRACYLEGKITDAVSGSSISGAVIEIVGGSISAKKQSDVLGHFKTGQAQAGTFTIKVSKLGYVAKEVQVNLLAGEVAVANVELTPVVTYSISGQAIEMTGGAPVPNAQIALVNTDSSYFGVADANGVFNLSGVIPGKYNVVAGKWGYQYGVVANQQIQANGNFTLKLEKGYRDDFVFDYGWQASGSSLTGLWQRGNPIGINPGFLIFPENDLPGDNGDYCYSTGNSTPDVGVDDVESGTSILTSPPMDLSHANDPSLKGFYWFTNFTQDGPLSDDLKFFVTNGSQEMQVASFTGGSSGWKPFTIKFDSSFALNEQVRLKIVAEESPNNPIFDSYEAGLDFFRVTDVASSPTHELADFAKLDVFPNPFRGMAAVGFSVPESGFVLEIFDLVGHRIQTLDLPGKTGFVQIGEGWKSGVYFARLSQNGLVAKTVKLVKAE